MHVVAGLNAKVIMISHILSSIRIATQYLHFSAAKAIHIVIVPLGLKKLTGGKNSNTL